MEARPRTNSRLLIEESPLQVLPSLAVSIGLNEAIFLQQLHYWLKSSTHEHDGRRWIYNSLDAWKVQFPFFTMSTLRRTIAELRRRGLLLAENYNESKQDRTLWYTIDYDAMEALHIQPSAETNTPSAQNEQMDLSKMSTPNAQSEQMLIEQETTQETTQRDGGGVAREAEKPIPKKQSERDEVVSRLFVIFESPKQTKLFIAAAVKTRGAFTLADVGMCEQWLAESNYSGKVGKLHNILAEGKLPLVKQAPPPQPILTMADVKRQEAELLLRNPEYAKLKQEIAASGW